MEKKIAWGKIFKYAKEHKRVRMFLWMLLQLLLQGIIDVLTGVWLCIKAIITMIMGVVFVVYLLICCVFNFPLPEWTDSLDESIAYDDTGASNDQITSDEETNASGINCSKSDENKR